MRGATLLETLMAVLLLALLAVAGSAWLRLVADSEYSVRPRLESEASLAAALRRIEEDLRSGDFGAPGRGARIAAVPRARIDGLGRLLVDTRDGGPATHVYDFDARSGSLRRASGDGRPWLLVAGLESWETSLESDGRVLRATWSLAGRSGSRRWIVP